MNKAKAVVYADGACLQRHTEHPGVGGWGALLASSSGKIKEMGGYEKRTTNNRMELKAVIEALIELSTWTLSQITICLDSKYVMDGATKHFPKWRATGWKKATGETVANLDLWKAFADIFDSVAREVELEWIYVPGHQGIPGNERVDQIANSFAKQAAEEPEERVEFIKGTVKDFVAKMKFDPMSIPKTADRVKKKEAAFYMSLVGGKVERHQTWAECEAKTKGRSGVKYKKIFSESEAEAVLKSWGVAPKK